LNILFFQCDEHFHENKLACKHVYGITVRNNTGNVTSYEVVTISEYFGRGGLVKQWRCPPRSSHSRGNTAFGIYIVDRNYTTHAFMLVVGWSLMNYFAVFRQSAVLWEWCLPWTPRKLRTSTSCHLSWSAPTRSTCVNH